MKKINLLITFLFFGMLITAQEINWQQVGKMKSTQEDFVLKSENLKTKNIVFNLAEYGVQALETPKGMQEAYRIRKGAHIQLKGAPDLDRISKSVLIHASFKTELKIVNTDFFEISNIEIAPSKGILTRDKNPQDVPFEYGDIYKKDEFFPGKLAELGTPYNIRDNRGQAIHIYPYQYNPVTKVLRIYTSIEVQIVNLEEEGENPIYRKTQTQESDAAFQKVFENQFLNYPTLKYTALPETGGKMLIITYDSFADEMQTFVDWKTSIGMQVQMVNYSTIGSASALKTYVSNYYTNNGLTYLLLVGDHAQVPSSSTSAGDSDNNYGYVSGSDHYLDIFVGRFSAENAADLTTMINRTIYYERDMSSSDAVISKALGIASNEGTGGGGDNNESDEQHMNNIETDLENYGYTVTKCYQDGGSTSQLSSIINSGTGLINYVGHGSNTSWAAPSFSNSNVNALTNTNKYPFIISVACVVGNFTGITCFAETWLRASHNGSPAGGLVFCGSTINQSWASPMRAQDEMADLLVANNYKSYGGIFVNGMFAMIDAYGNDGERMADTWTVFGDPSVQTRTPGHPNGQGSQSGCGIPTNLNISSITNISAKATWNMVSGAQNYTFAYKASTASNWTEVSVNTTSYTLTGLTKGTQYTCKVKTNCSGEASNYSGLANFTTTGGVINYCAASGKNSRYEWIKSVNIGSFTKNSNAAGYTDFTSETISMKAGSSYNVNLTPGFASRKYTEYWKIWIDFNKNGSFDDAGEELFAANSKEAVTGSIAIPANAEGTTRMRIAMRYNATPSTCGSFSYGEVEDYTVNITRSRLREEELPTTLTVLVGPNPNNGVFDVNISGDEAQVELQLMNISGQVIFTDLFTKMNGNYTYEFSKPDLAKGVYFLRILCNEQKYTHKVVVR